MYSPGQAWSTPPIIGSVVAREPVRLCLVSGQGKSRDNGTVVRPARSFPPQDPAADALTGPFWQVGLITTALVATAAVLLLTETSGRWILAAIGLGLFATVAVVGFVVTHGRWARRALVAAVSGGLFSLVLVPATNWWWAAVALDGLALAVAVGPPLDRWTRRLPPPAPLPAPSILLALGLLAVPFVAGVAGASPAGIGWSIVAVVTAWAFGRGYVAALWAARAIVPALGVIAAFAAGSVAGTVAIAAVTATTGIWAWNEAALLTVAPLEPRRVDPKPVFPEMAPEEVRRVAGIDERGRPL